MTLIDLGAIWNAKIDAKLAIEDANERATHVRQGGGLAAGRLGWPLQWQVLYALGVPPRPVDAFLLRKFERGKSIEAWILDALEPEARQLAVSYRGVAGVADAVMRLSTGERIPLEIKSVANAKYKWLLKRDEADQGHLLQAALYGMALKSDQCAIAYVASDDLRVTVFARETSRLAPGVDELIDRFGVQYPMIPVFRPEEPWQAEATYNLYHEWAALTEDECAQKFEWWQKHPNVRVLVPSTATDPATPA